MFSEVGRLWGRGFRKALTRGRRSDILGLLLAVKRLGVENGFGAQTNAIVQM